MPTPAPESSEELDSVLDQTPNGGSFTYLNAPSPTRENSPANDFVALNEPSSRSPSP